LGAEKRLEKDAKTTCQSKKGENWRKKVKNWENFLKPQKSRPPTKKWR